MQEASQSFIRGLRYIAAARRCEAWCGEDHSVSVFRRLAGDYRGRAFALMSGTGDGLDRGVCRPSPSVLGRESNRAADF